MAQEKTKQLFPMPPFVAAWEVARLELIRASRGRALRAASAIVAILVVTAIVSCIVGSGDSRATFLGTVRRLFPWLTMGLALLFSARSISDDVESGILSYFHLLPVPRWVVTFGKYVSSGIIVTSILLGATVLLYLGTHVAEPGLILDHHLDLWTACGTTIAAGLCYTAVFLFFGSAVTDLPYLLPLLYIAVFEVGLGSLPVVEVISIRHHVNVLMGITAQASTEGMVDQVLEFLGLVTPVVPPWAAVLVIASVFATFLGLSLLVTEVSEYRTGRP